MNGVDKPPVKPSQRVKLNVGGHRYETTAATLTCNGPDHYFCSLLRHTPASDFESELFIDRDGDAFGPLLNFLRTGTLSIPPTKNEATVRSEADFYCITLPASDEESNQVRCDGLYLSFAPGATPREGAGDEESGGSEVRAYLIFEEEGRASLGRREANGQWSALRCRYRCLAGGLLLVHHAANGVATEPPLAAAPEGPPAGAGGAPAEEDGGEEQDGLGQLELSAVVLGSSFIRVIACGRVGRLEHPFHFFPSGAPSAGSAFISQVAQPAPGRPAGRVLLSFADSLTVGVMVTSSQPGWSSAANARYELGRPAAARTFSPVPITSTAAATATATDGLVALQPARPPRRDSLCHVKILDNQNFSRTVDLISLGPQGLVEFVQLNAQHEPQLIWYRPLLRTPNPWAAPVPGSCES